MMRYDLIVDDEKNETYRLWIEQYVGALTDTIYLLADPNYKNPENDFSVAQRIELLEKSLSIFEIVKFLVMFIALYVSVAARDILKK